MALSVMKDREGPDWPLGFVAVPHNGTPVCIMHNVDANNNWAPAVSNAPGQTPGPEYTPTCHKIGIQGYHPGSSNNGMVINTGNVYVLRVPVGGNGNRTDSGAMVKVVPQGGDYVIPSAETQLQTLSPYRYFLDADVNGDGALVTLYV